jgi:hypothetical protein
MADSRGTFLDRFVVLERQSEQPPTSTTIAICLQGKTGSAPFQKGRGRAACFYLEAAENLLALR